MSGTYRDVWKAPTSIGLTVHNVDRFEAQVSAAVDGALVIRGFNSDGCETAYLVFFTGDGALADAVASAITDAIAKLKASREVTADAADEAAAPLEGVAA